LDKDKTKEIGLVEKKVDNLQQNIVELHNFIMMEKRKRIELDH